MNAGGLNTGDIVTIDGVKVGTITGMALDGDKVKVTFALQPGLHLGSTTSAAAKVLSPVGTEYMELTPSGPGTLSPLIPEARTTVPYNLVTDLSGLGSEIQQYNIPELGDLLRGGGSREPEHDAGEGDHCRVQRVPRASRTCSLTNSRPWPPSSPRALP